MTEDGRVSEQKVTFHYLSPGAPPWHQEQVRLDGEPIGYLLYRHIAPLRGMTGPGWSQYLISGAAHRPVGPRCSFLDRHHAVVALLAEVTAGAQAA